MTKINKTITSTLFAAALLAISPNAFSITATELQEKLTKDVTLPFSMGLLGPLTDAKVSVEGDGPFVVTITDSMIDDSPMPVIAFTVVDEGEVLKIKNAVVDGDAKVDLGGQATITISGLGWSGTWDLAQDDFTEFSYSTSGIDVSATEFPAGLKIGENSLASDYSEVLNQQNSKFGMSNIVAMFDGSAMSDDVGEFSYNVSDIQGQSSDKAEQALPLFKLLRSISRVALNAQESLEDADARKAVLLDWVDQLFVPVTASKTTTAIRGMTNTQGNPEFKYTQTIGESSTTSTYGASEAKGEYEINSTGEMSDYGVILTSENAMLNAEANLKIMNTTVLADGYEPAKLKAALIEMIETGNENPENISVSAVFDALYSFGGIAAKYDGTSFDINHSMMGNVFTSTSMGASIDVNSKRGDDRYTGQMISFDGLSVPAVSLANLPTRVVPENVSVSFGLEHSPLPYYTDLVGRDNISALIKEEIAPDELLFSNLDKYLTGFNASTVSPELRVALSGDGYDFAIDAKFELDGAFDPAVGPAPDVKGVVKISGVDGLKAFIIGLSPDLSEDMQAGVFGAVGALGIMESMGQREDDGTLVYNIEMNSTTEITVNGNTFPIPN